MGPAPSAGGPGPAETGSAWPGSAWPGWGTPGAAAPGSAAALPVGDAPGHDDLDAPPPGRATGGAPADDDAAAAEGRRRGRGRRVTALLLAAALGAGGALLAARGQDAGGASLVALGSYPDSSGGTWGQDGDLSLTVVVGNTGDQDLVVLGGGNRTAGGVVVGEVAPTGAARAQDRPGAGDVADLPSGSTAVLQLTVSASCEEPPPWQPVLRVRTPSGDTAEVAPAVLQDPTGSGLSGFEDACSYALLDQPFTLYVVGQRISREGLVLRVRNDTDAAYGVEVLSGGVAGLELVDPGVVLEPSGTTEVAVRIAPRSCEAALRSSDLVTDVAVQARRSGEGEGAGVVRLDLDPYGTSGAVGVGVGRACAAGV